MYSKLVATELEVNKFILLPFLAVVLFLFVYLGISERSTNSFMAASLVSFWACLIVGASKAGHEKRDRQYMQLPVTATEVFLATWTYCLALLLVTVLSWLCYGMLFGNDPLQQVLVAALNGAFGVLIFTALVSLGIDLSAFRPRYIQWLYLGAIVLLFALAIHLDLSVGLIGRDDGFLELLPIALIDNDPVEIVLAASVFLILFIVDLTVYRNNDSYLG